jgi:hypothetical protein
MFGLTKNVDGRDFQRNFDRIMKESDKVQAVALMVSLEVAMKFGDLVKNGLLKLRYQQDNTSMIEVQKGGETVFRGRTGQTPEITSLDESGFQQIKEVTEQPVGTELNLKEPLESLSIKVDDKEVFAVENNLVTVNEMLSPKQLDLIEKADEVIDKYGSMNPEGTEVSYFIASQEGPYNISRSADNLQIRTSGSFVRDVMDAKAGVFQPEEVDYATFAKGSTELKPLDYEVRSPVSFERE